MATATKKPVTKTTAKKPATRGANTSPAVPAFKSIAFRGHDALVFRTCLEQAAKFVATDDSRPVLTGVAIDIAPGAIKFASADGFRLIVVKHEHADIKGTHPRIIVSAASVKQIIAFVTAKQKELGRLRLNDLEMTFDGQTFTVGEAGVTAGRSSFTIDIVAGSYPNYEQLVPKVEDDIEGRKVGVNALYAGDVMRLVERYTKVGIVHMQPGESPSQPIRYDWLGGDGESTWCATAIVMPMVVTWPMPRTAI